MWPRASHLVVRPPRAGVVQSRSHGRAEFGPGPLGSAGSQKPNLCPGLGLASGIMETMGQPELARGVWPSQRSWGGVEAERVEPRTLKTLQGPSPGAEVLGVQRLMCLGAPLPNSRTLGRSRAGRAACSLTVRRTAVPEEDRGSATFSVPGIEAEGATAGSRAPSPAQACTASVPGPPQAHLPGELTWSS